MGQKHYAESSIATVQFDRTKAQVPPLTCNTGKLHISSHHGKAHRKRKDHAPLLFPAKFTPCASDTLDSDDLLRQTRISELCVCACLLKECMEGDDAGSRGEGDRR